MIKVLVSMEAVLKFESKRNGKHPILVDRFEDDSIELPWGLRWRNLLVDGDECELLSPWFTEVIVPATLPN
jgi:hypothetical protein